MEQQANRAHRVRKEKKTPQKGGGPNPKAFAFAHPGRGQQQARRTHDHNERRLHVPLVDRLPEEAPPLIVAVMGPPGVGKTTLIKSLVKRYTKHSLVAPKGPLTVVSGKKRRLTFIEVPSDSLASMIDTAKVADLVILLIDGNFGFEMETMEFLNVLAATGMPGNVVGVLTHLDLFKKAAPLRDAKKRLKHRFWKELWQGAKLFYLSGVINGRYPDREIHNLSRFVSIQKNPRPIIWRNAHSYCLADRFLDITQPTAIEANPKCDRTIALYGYLRGTNFPASGSRVHVPGVGDLSISGVEALPDPCPSPFAEQRAAKQSGKPSRKRLGEKQKMLFAPMSDVGGVLVDKDAVYIDVKTSTFNKDKDAAELGPGEQMMVSLQGGKRLLGQAANGMRLFSGADTLLNGEDDDTGRKHVRSARLADQDGDDELPEGGSDDGSTGEDNMEDGEQSDNEQMPRALGRAFRDDVDTVGGPDDVAFADSDSELGSVSSDDDQVLESGASDFDEEDEDDGSDDEGEDGDEDEFGELRWKDNLQETARKLHASKRKVRASDLARLLYDMSISPAEVVQRWRGEAPAPATNGDTHEEDDFFQKSTKREQEEELDDGQTLPKYDYAALEKKWSDPEQLEELRQRFKSSALLKDGDGSDDDEEFSGVDDDSEGDGEFEDLEAGDDEEEEEEAQEEEALTLEAEREKNARKKEELKLRFEEEDREGFLNDKANARREGGQDEFGEDEWYDAQKAGIKAQLDLNRAEFEQLDDTTRARVEGYRAGTYARLVLENVPCEFSTQFDPRFPIVVGGLSAAEERMGFVQVRIKRHRWHKRVLKSNDPLIISLGWRRFQTLPIYSTSDSRTRNRMLKYTPEHMHCFGTFYGPLVAPNTGFCAVQSLSNATAGFRVAATGVVQDVDAAPGGGGPGPLVKKLKLTGEPARVFRNTAFIKGMFTSALEIAKFEGAALRTVSGVRGQIKRALSTPEGTFRATFEDKILMSDLVFLRAWYPVRPHRFYNPVTNLLAAADAPAAAPDSTPTDVPRADPDAAWTAMRTTGALRAALALPTPDVTNSRYRAVARPTRHFNPLRVPAKLAAELPFRSQATRTPSRRASGRAAPYVVRRAVVADGEEKRLRALMSMVGAVRADKEAKRAAKRAEQRSAWTRRVQADAARRADREKRDRAEYWRTEGKRRRGWGGADGDGGGGGGGKRRKGGA